MTTIVNSATPEVKESGSFGFLIGTIIIVAFIAVLLYFAVPAIRNMGPIQVTVPSVTVEAPVTVEPVVVPTPAAPAPAEGE